MRMLDLTIESSADDINKVLTAVSKTTSDDMTVKVWRPGTVIVTADGEHELFRDSDDIENGETRSVRTWQGESHFSADVYCVWYTENGEMKARDEG